MAISNLERIGKALEIMNTGLLPFLEREMKAVFKSKWLDAARESMRTEQPSAGKGAVHWDTQAILAVLWNHWNTVFRNTLGPSERSLVSELRDIRNKWAHQEAFSTDDAYRALDSIHRLLSAVSAMEATEVEKSKQEILRIRFEEQARYQKRKATASSIQGTPVEHLKPWRQIATPHDDVASGRYQQAEFAADLRQVVQGKGSAEYTDPEEFFSRTFLTDGLNDLLADALRRLSGQGGNPIVKLQTNFGGGKTHSMIALYHLFSGVSFQRLAGVESIMRDLGISEIPRANRAVFVGTASGAATVVKHDDGCETRTVWGEIAWNLLGKDGYKIVEEADRSGINPGSDTLVKLLSEASPCVVLIDEWIAYVRQLYQKYDLPAGSFESNTTFAQSLSEAARSVPKALVVASIPSSTIEIGGEGGHEALAKLENTFARMESPWRPASAEESFEIVRRRLFKPIKDEDQVAKDTVVRTFSDFYRDQSQEFPSECKEVDYRRRMEAAYPIHPELFKRLYDDWSSLEKFQRTRGVLRLMAAVIHTLWERNDSSLLIMPSMIALDDNRVLSEFTRYLEGPWDAVIGRDIDGSNSLPVRVDSDNPNLGRYSACRRVARTVFIGSAPTLHAANKGIDDVRIKLGCAQPGESPSVFGDALRRLTDQSTHLYVDNRRFWYSTQPTVTRLAQDRAQQVSDDAVQTDLAKRLSELAKYKGEFHKVHSCPNSSADIPDEMETRLVILPPESQYAAKNGDSPALELAKEILQNRGTVPRDNKNALIFLVADKSRMRDLDQAVRNYLAWDSIRLEAEQLNLDAFQTKQAKTKASEADDTVTQRIPEAYCWAVFPSQSSHQAEMEWQAIRVQGSDTLAERVSKRLIREEQLITTFAGLRLRMELDRIPLWKDESVRVKELSEFFAKYVYLPRLKSPRVLEEAIRDGLRNLSWSTETFAYANGYDEEEDRYLGLTAGRECPVTLDGDDLLVKPDVALNQFETEKKVPEGTPGQYIGDTDTPGDRVTSGGSGTLVGGEPEEKILRRFFGSVEIDPMRVGKDAGRIAEEVISHLSGLMKSKLQITLEIHADVPKGVPENVVRTVTENCRTLKFTEHGFEEE